MKTGSGFTIVEGIETLCLCGVAVKAGDTDKGQFVVLHGMPVCADFDKREPADFLEWLRKQHEKTMGNN